MLRPNDQFELSLLTEWLNSADVGLCVIDDDHRVIMLNSASCRLLGVCHSDSVNRPIHCLLGDPGDASELTTWLAGPASNEGRCIVRDAQDARSHLLLKHRVIDHASGARFKIISVTDVTALLESQAQVAAQQRIEAEQRQWQALNAGVVISSALDADMPIIYVNQMFERMSGYTSAEILGKNCRFLQGHEREQPGVKALGDAIRNQVNGYAVLRNYRKDGSLFINELFISPIRNADGQVIQFVGIQHLRPEGYRKDQADA